jgi:hypothetical protein
MCIVQDDQDDWSRESATMSKVYGLATCTIAAALDGNGNDGCFANRNKYRVRPYKIPNPFTTNSNLSFYVRSQYLSEIYKREVMDWPWYSRGWVFQERTLTPRLLIFGKTQILWSCHKLQQKHGGVAKQVMTSLINLNLSMSKSLDFSRS